MGIREKAGLSVYAAGIFGMFTGCVFNLPLWMLPVFIFLCAVGAALYMDG